MVACRAATRVSERGYAMVALLVALAVIAVFASVAMPVWRTVIQREKEEELVFRGQQYVRAIRLFQRKFANAYPPSIDLLVDQKFLRRKYKDPMTDGGDFVVLYQNMLQQGRPGTAVQQVGGRGGAVGTTMGGRAGEISQPGAGLTQTPLANLEAVGPRGGVAGVASKSTKKGFRTYNGREKYNEWQFIFVQTARPGQVGAGGPGRMQPGSGVAQPGMGPGGRGGGPGGRGFGGGRGPGTP